MVQKLFYEIIKNHAKLDQKTGEKRIGFRALFIFIIPNGIHCYIM